MINRLIPNYPAFLTIGLLIVVSGLFVLLAGRDILISIWVDKLFDGNTDDGLFKAAQTAEQVIGHTLTIWFFLGLSFIKLGIGFAIATIVQNLRLTGRLSLSSYASAGLDEAQRELDLFEEPWFGRWFTRFLFSGILVLGFFFLLTLWWDVNLVFLTDAEFDGRTSGFAYESYLLIERVLGAVIFGGKFLGEALLIFGILTGLATIIWNLSRQARNLPELARRAMNEDNPNRGAPLDGPGSPSALVKLGTLGFVVLALAFPLALIRSGFIGWALGRQFEGGISETALRLDGILGRTIDPLTNLGLGILFFTIALLLLVIIRWLGEQRRAYGNLSAEVSGAPIPHPGTEPQLWPARWVTPFAIFGIVVIGFFFFTMTGVRDLNFNHLLSLQFSGDTVSGAYQSAVRLDRILGPVIGATRFIGIASLFMAIGLALVAIVVNLRATALALPQAFSKLIGVAGGGSADDDDDEDEIGQYDLMELAPWNLFRPLFLGLLIVISGTLPVVVFYGWSINRMLGEQFAGSGAAGATSDLYESSFLANNLFGASLTPWMLFGMGIILFSVGRFFSTIVGFVEARRMVMIEGNQAIAEAVSSPAVELVSGD